MENIEYEKDGVRKFAQARFKDELIAVGWKVVGEEKFEEKEVLDRDALKAEADALEIEYPKNIKTEKLYQMVYEAKAE
jgi:hypothetical protein